MNTPLFNTPTLNTAVRKRSVDIAGHRTSESIEEPFWEALREIATTESVSINDLVTRIDSERTGNLSSAIRVYVLRAVAEHRATHG